MQTNSGKQVKGEEIVFNPDLTAVIFQTQPQLRKGRMGAWRQNTCDKSHTRNRRRETHLQMPGDWGEPETFVVEVHHDRDGMLKGRLILPQSRKSSITLWKSWTVSALIFVIFVILPSKTASVVEQLQRHYSPPSHQ